MALNESGTASDKVELDTTLPVNQGVTISTSGADKWHTPTVNINVAISATDLNLYEMWIDGDVTGAGVKAWVAYAANAAVELTTGDGTKNVTIKFRDNANNESGSAQDSVLLDTTGPANEAITANGTGATIEYTPTTSVGLSLYATDATGVYEMYIDGDVTGTGVKAWVAYTAAPTIELTTGDGLKTISVKYRDQSLNESGVAQDTITLDTALPTSLAVTINNGDLYTVPREVSLNINAVDPIGVYQMYISGDVEGSNVNTWISYAAQTDVTLISGTGTKTVTVQFRDHALNTTGTVSDTIYLDNTDPAILVVVPTADAIGIMPWATVVFDVTDDVQVVTGTIMVTLNRSLGDQLAIAQGVAQSGYAVNIASISGGYRISLDHDIRFAIGEYVTVNVLVKDLNNNTSVLSYEFRIINDSTAPSAPITVRAVAVPNTRVDLTWAHEHQEDVQLFKVYRVLSTEAIGAGTLIATTNGSTLAYSDTTVVTGNSYYFYVTAEDIYLNESVYSNYAGAPYISVVTRNMTIAAPTAGGYDGNATDMVPGAKLTYVTRFINNGYSPANNVTFRDAIPDHTTYVDTSAEADATANITVDLEEAQWQMNDRILPFEERTTTFSVTVN